MSDVRYRIGTAARLSGVSTHLIRIWERRYQSLSPDRSEGGSRLYSDAEVERLRLLRRAVDLGHAIGQVAGLPPEELLRLVEPEEPRASEPNAVSGNEIAEELVAAVGDFDWARAERALQRASATLSPRMLVLDVLAPTLKLVGSAWARGNLCVASEHMASALVRDYAGVLLREYTPDPGAETIVLTTPAGEPHELGAVLAAVTVAMHGFRAAFLGANLPADDIVQAARQMHASAIALSIVSLDPKAALAEIRSVQRALPKIPLLLGGASASVVAASLTGLVEVHASLQELEHWLDQRRSKR
jgi:MerR family transcriptional regulator, light-induced transcriptional regulator